VDSAAPIETLTVVEDRTYDDIRAMLAAVQKARFLSLR
jgi:hypothetical protein